MRAVVLRLTHRQSSRRVLSRAPPLWISTRIHHPIGPRWASTSGPSINSDPSPNATPVDDFTGNGGKQKKNDWNDTAFKMAESALTTFASITILGLVGYGYTRYYKHLVLEKMENAFNPGDPVLELAANSKSVSMRQTSEKHDETLREHWVVRDEQAMIDAIVNGSDRGKYHLLIGEKGTGKSSMLIDAMRKIDGEGCAMFDAHADLEIFRIRLGKALDFEYHEDNIGSLFSIRGPRDASALLDIERAFNKLEKVALRRRKKTKGERPLILIINSIHLLRDDEDGRDLLELIQQRAEAWAASNLCTVVLNSDDYWVYEKLKNLATRMQVTPVRDLPKDKAINALSNYRIKYFNEIPAPSILEQVYDRVGGRLTFLNRVAKAEDMLKVCDAICEHEKTWFLNKCMILGMEMDDDVMDQQKFASAAMVLAKALVDREKEMETTYDIKIGHILPQMPLSEAYYVMTRVDFMKEYDHINVFTIDSSANVRADSVPMMNAFREVCNKEGFEEHLEKTLDRIGDIESLGRTKELTIKDLWEGGKYRFAVKNSRGQTEKETVFDVAPKNEDDSEEKENLWPRGR